MAPDDLLAGRYRPVRLLGTGGMARVLLCEDERLGRQVAVKRLHAHSPDDIALRFQREARLGASLNHPNLVGVYDVATDDESVLIVMEYVEGATLADEVHRGPLAEGRVAAIVTDVAAALDAVHAKGIVHRDVKPANVLLRTDGVAKLADLGIATLLEGTSITVSGTVLGTASYMAPEQVDGGDVGPAADIYALAAVAFEALSGTKARTGDTPMAVAHSVANDPPPDIREAWPAAPEGVASALTRAMARRPGDRQHRAGDLATELRAALEASGAPTLVSAPTEPAAVVPAPAVAADPEPEPEPAAVATHRARRPWLPVAGIGLVAAVALAAFLLLSGGGGGRDSASKTTASRPPATKTTPKRTESKTTPAAPAPTTATTTAPSASPKPVSETGSQLNARGYKLLQSGNFAGAVPVLQRAVAAFPQGSTQIDYAFALFNLAQALNASGRPAEAIPLLERRLSFSDNQRPVVEKELQSARAKAGGAAPAPGDGKGKPKKN